MTGLITDERGFIVNRRSSKVAKLRVKLFIEETLLQELSPCITFLEWTKAIEAVICSTQRSRCGSGTGLSCLAKYCLIPSPGRMGPTVIDKNQPIESIRLRLRDEKCEVVEAVNFDIQLLYTLNLWS